VIIVYTSQFKKDYKKAKKQGRNLGILKDVINKIINKEQLGPKYKDHKLSGSLCQYRELHLQSDWLLLYKISPKDNELILARIGSHSELFK
jgi:mRNA interferase YafQ